MRARIYLAYSVLKALAAIPLLPVFVVLFLVSKEAFVDALAFFWPHLDIFTPEGELYLRRWFFFPKVRRGPLPRFLHLICLSDEGRDPHDHPGAFTTTILWNGYNEEIFYPGLPARSWGRPGNPFIRHVRAGNTYVNPEGHTHAVKLIGPTLTWVVGWRKGKPWGFWKLHETDPSQDVWIESNAYGDKGEERKSWTIDGK